MKKLYLYFTVKTPILSFGAIGLFFILFFGICYNTKIEQYEVQEANYSESFIYTKGNTNIKNGSKIYFYHDKNENIFEMCVVDVKPDKKKMKITVLMNQKPISNMSGYIDIPGAEVSLIEYIVEGIQNGI